MIMYKMLIFHITKKKQMQYKNYIQQKKKRISVNNFVQYQKQKLVENFCGGKVILMCIMSSVSE
jgi:hypothetical protein